MKRRDFAKLAAAGLAGGAFGAAPPLAVSIVEHDPTPKWAMDELIAALDSRGIPRRSGPESQLLSFARTRSVAGSLAIRPAANAIAVIGAPRPRSMT